MADELVKVEASSTAIVPIPDLPDWLGLHKHMSVSTFDTKTQAGLRMLSKMGAGCDYNVSDFINKHIDIVSWYMSPYERQDEVSGEMVPLVFIGIVDSEGRTYKCSSIGVRKSLLLFAREFGFQPWIPPVRVLVKSIKLAVGNMFNLEFVSKLESTANLKGKRHGERKQSAGSSQSANSDAGNGNAEVRDLPEAEENGP